MGEEKKVTKYALKKTLFPNATILVDSGMTEHKTYANLPENRLFEVVIGANEGLHKDHTISLFVHEDTILANPDWFEPIFE